MRVRVVIERINRPGWRINTTAIGLSTRAWDPALAAREMAPQYETAIEEDRPFAARLVERIGERASSAGYFEMPGAWRAR
jgi:hypothetical protein